MNYIISIKKVAIICICVYDNYLLRWIASGYCWKCDIWSRRTFEAISNWFLLSIH